MRRAVGGILICIVILPAEYRWGPAWRRPTTGSGLLAIRMSLRVAASTPHTLSSCSSHRNFRRPGAHDEGIAHGSMVVRCCWACLPLFRGGIDGDVEDAEALGAGERAAIQEYAPEFNRQFKADRQS